MVRTLALASDWRVVITIFRPSGSSVLHAVNDMGPLDAFDYAIHAQGYFRFAIQDMDCSRIEIDVITGPDAIAIDGRSVETIEITRD